MYSDNLGIESDCDWGIPIVDSDLNLPESYMSVYDE